MRTKVRRRDETVEGDTGAEEQTDTHRVGEAIVTPLRKRRLSGELYERDPYDEESGELSPEVEVAAGAYDPFSTPDFDDPDYRSRLDAVIEALPTEQSRIILMSGSFSC